IRNPTGNRRAVGPSQSSVSGCILLFGRSVRGDGSVWGKDYQAEFGERPARRYPMSPLVSVVMPTHNGQEFIAAALASVREQEDDGIELVVVDDGSTDQTQDIVRDYAKILPIRMISSGGIGNWVSASNIGLKEARGEWVCFLHQDDLWLAGRLARLRKE